MSNEGLCSRNLVNDLERLSWEDMNPDLQSRVYQAYLESEQQCELAERVDRRLREIVGERHAESIDARSLFTQWDRAKLHALVALVDAVDHARAASETSSREQQGE